MTMKTSSKKWQKIRKIKGLRQFVTWYPRHVSENPGYRVITRNDNINFRYNKDKWYKGYIFTWSNIKRNILHDMGRTATTGEFKDGSFKIKLTTSDKVSKYSVYFKDKNFDGSIKALKNVTGIGKNSKVFSIFDKYGTKTVKTIEDVVGLIGG